MKVRNLSFVLSNGLFLSIRLVFSCVFEISSIRWIEGIDAKPKRPIGGQMEVEQVRYEQIKKLGPVWKLTLPSWLLKVAL